MNGLGGALSHLTPEHVNPPTMNPLGSTGTRGHTYQTAHVPGTDSVAQTLRRPADPTHTGFGHPPRPFWGGDRLKVAGRVLEPGDDLRQVLLLQLPKDGLRMRVAGLQMAVMEKENFIDHGTYHTEGAVASIGPTAVNYVTLAGHKG